MISTSNPMWFSPSKQLSQISSFGHSLKFSLGFFQSRCWIKRCHNGADGFSLVSSRKNYDRESFNQPARFQAFYVKFIIFFYF